MRKFILKDSVLIVILISIACACYFPLLPYGMTMMAYSLIIIVFAVLAILSWHERASDEREEKHRSISAQVAFFFGGFTLIAGIVYTGVVEHVVNPWISAAFIAMLLGRVVGRVWAERNE